MHRASAEVQTPSAFMLKPMLISYTCNAMNLMRIWQAPFRSYSGLSKSSEVASLTTTLIEFHWSCRDEDAQPLRMLYIACWIEIQQVR